MINDKVEVRERILDELKKELLGPGSEGFSENENEEVIWESPSKRYSTGILYPINTTIIQDEKTDDKEYENLEIETEENKIFVDNTKGEEPIIDSNIDEALTFTNQFKPSSMGLTFFVKGNIDTISISYSYGKYRKALRTDIRTTITKEEESEIKSKVSAGNFVVNDGVIELISSLNIDEAKKIKEQIKSIDEWTLKKLLNKMIDFRYSYKRMPFIDENLTFDFINKSNISQYIDDTVRIFVKRKYYTQNDKTSFTIVLINNSDLDGEKNNIFQPKIVVSSDINECKLVNYSSNPLIANRMTDEEKNLELLFRSKQKYGVGHGVSVEYQSKSDKWQIETVFLPEHEVESMNFDIDDLPDEILSMEMLSSVSELSDIEIIDNLNKLANSYDVWLHERSEEIDLIEAEFEYIAKSNIKKANTVLSRIKLGINVLKDNDNAMIAFKDANLSMLMQRVQGANRKKNIFPEDKVEVTKVYIGTDIEKAKWRAFQLAFFLMSIES
ncbi:MAG: hypothetical protein WBA54_07510, partial [Acidaminobacteraceae bacterium]